MFFGQNNLKKRNQRWKCFFKIIVFFHLKLGNIHCLNNYNRDVIFTPNIQQSQSGRFSYLYPAYSKTPENNLSQTNIPWEDALKESAKITLKDKTISAKLLQKATYLGYIDLDKPRFGDIVVIAKGKLKQSANGSFFFEQINESCDHQCQQHADQYLNNVTALWMVERIRHRDPELGHRYDLKFTIVPILDDHELKDNVLENWIKNQPQKTFILRDFDYPNYFLSPATNRRTDLFTPNFDRSLFMGYHPSTIFQEKNSRMNFIASPVPYFQNLSVPPRKSILNLGEYFIQPSVLPKYQNPNNVFLPSVNTHASPHKINGRFKFPDSREGSLSTFLRSQNNAHDYNQIKHGNLPTTPTSFEKPELKQEQNNHRNFLIDHRGAVEHIFTKNNMNNKLYFVKPTTNTHPSQQKQQHQSNVYQIPQQSTPNVQNQNIQQPVGGKQFLITQMPVQYVQSSYVFPQEIQQAPINNPLLFRQQQQTPVRYQMQPILDLGNFYSQPQSTPAFHYLPKIVQYQPIQNVIRFVDDSTVNHQNSTNYNFQLSEKIENKYYSQPDPVYFPSTTENYAAVTTYSSDPSTYNFLINPQIETSFSTVSSRNVEIYNDNIFQPMVTPFKLSRIVQLQNNDENKNERTIIDAGVLKNPNLINSQLSELETNENITLPYVSLNDEKENIQKAIPELATDNLKEKINATESYNIILKRPKFHQKTTEKPILKWTPKKSQDSTNISAFLTFQSPFFPTPVPTEKTMILNLPQKQPVKKFTRGRNRFISKRTSTTTSTPLQLTSVVNKKKIRTTTSPTTKTNNPFQFSTVFPRYVPTESTNEAITLQSSNTSNSLVVSKGTSTNKFEKIQAVIDPLVTNLTNIKLYRATVNVENEFAKSTVFDNLTYSILNHARAIGTVESDEII